MDWFPLPIFPEGSLSNSVFTTVWVGVMVSFFNLRLGWVYSGLVVPGYLIPLAMEKPWVAVVVIFEAILTLWTVRGMMYLLPKLGLACEWFGRDRFFAMILVSAFYRLTFDVWLLPALGVFLRDQLGIVADFSNTLHSFGLIVICLLANQLFKTGVLRGAIPFLVTSGITWIIIRYGLMEFTNFNITSLSFLYEDVAASIYAAPKAYIVLITASIISSWMNLRYGWDFNGIMIPALLSLQWYEPLKIATSIFEALIILYASMLLLKIRPFNQMTMEGARKVMLFFTVSLVYKMLVGWGLYLIAPEVKSTDYYGFGYLLPTLMAIKMHALNKVAHQIRIVVQVSLLSVVAANIVGFALLLVPPFFETTPRATPFESSPNLVKENKPAFDIYRDNAFALLIPEVDQTAMVKRHEAAHHFERLISEMLSPAPSQETVKKLLSRCQCQAKESEDGLIILTSLVEGRELLLVINPRAANQLLVKAPLFREDVSLIPTTWSLSKALAPRLLLLSDDYQNLSENTLHPFVARLHDQYADGGILEISTSLDSSESLVLSKLPRDLNLAPLREKIPDLKIIWSSRSELNLAPLPIHGGYLKLSVPLSTFIHTQTKHLSDSEGGKANFDDLVALTHPVFGETQDKYSPPTLGELRMMRDLIIQPALAFSNHSEAKGTLSLLRYHAAFLDYKLTVFDDLLFLSDISSPARFRGGLALRIPSLHDNAERKPLNVLQIPSRSFADGLVRHSIASLLKQSSDIVIWAQTKSDSNSQGLTELTRFDNKNSILHLSHESVLRAKQKRKLAVLQLASLAPEESESKFTDDILIVSNDYSSTGNIPETISAWKSKITKEGYAATVVDTQQDQADLAIGANLQDTAMYLSGGNHAFAKVWLSPALKSSFGPVEDYTNEKKRLRSLSIKEREITNISPIQMHPNPNGLKTLKNTLSRYRSTRNILILSNLQNNADIELQMWTSRFFQTPSLALVNKYGKPFLLVNLSEFSTSLTTTADRTTIDQWLLEQSTFLESPKNQ